MKKIKIYILLGLALASCNKDFLEKNPISSVATSNFYKTGADITIAVNGVYNSLKLIGQYYNFYILAEQTTDNMRATGSPGTNPGVDLNQFSFNSGTALFGDVWKDNYVGLYRCNTLLNRIGEVSMDESLKARYIGEVKFLRALMYFNLVRFFGEVPLVLTEITDTSQGYSYVRSAVSDVYKQIISDLNEAEAALPAAYAGVDVGRATKGAAKSLLGKVYLTQRNFYAAATKLKEVIDMNVYNLLPNYIDVFKAANKNGDETVFSVQYKGGLFLNGQQGSGSPFSNLYAPLGSQPYVLPSTALGTVVPTDDIINAYEPGDKRKDASVATSYTGAGGAVVNVNYCKKFPDAPAITYDGDNNWPVIRYSDVLLMYAESLNELGYQSAGDAFKYYNKVRERANLGSKTATELPDQDSFRLAIEKERRVELAFEGHRWFDLLRTNRAVPVLNSKAKYLGIINTDGSRMINANNLLYPIPQDQVKISNGVIVQNPGY